MTSSPVHSFISPAKLNLFLHVVGQRSDGYHNLQTLFQFLNYGDTLNISVNDSDNIQLLTPMAGVESNDNLIVKAALLLKKELKKELKKSTLSNKSLIIKFTINSSSGCFISIKLKDLSLDDKSFN